MIKLTKNRFKVKIYLIFTGYLLKQATKHSHLSMVKLLLGKGAKLEDATFCPQYEKVNFHIIKYLLKRGANPKATDNYGNTLLHKECDNGNLKNVKYLIQHYNADVSAKNKQGQTPLHLSCEPNNLKSLQSFLQITNRKIRHCWKIVKFLIEDWKVDPTVCCYTGKTILHYAAKNIFGPNILRYLIEDQEQDIEATDNEGRTILHAACRNNHHIFFEDKWETQKYLIIDHANIIEAKDKKGKTALFYFLEDFMKNREDLFQDFRPIALILATKAKILQTQENKDTDHVFDWIKQSYDNDRKKSKGEDEAVYCLIIGLKEFRKQFCFNSQTKIEEDEEVSCLIAKLNMFQKQEKDTEIKYNPLLLIVDYCNRVDIAEFMFNQDLCYIENHFNTEEANSKRKLLLKSYLQFSCQNGLLDLTRFLFQEICKKQESFQLFTFDGSFLKTACYNKHFNVFKYLLEDDQAKDEAAEFLNDFPLHYACKRGSLEMVQYLIETKKIDIEVKDKEGRTPLHLACIEGSIEITKYIIEKQNANINAADNKGRSVLHFACMSGFLELVEYISQKLKKDVNIQDEDGSSALHLACEQDKPNLKVVKFIITDMKADHQSVDKRGRTPLHVHCQSDWPNVSTVKFLVNQGANVLEKDNSGKFPLQIPTTEYNPYKAELITFLKAVTKR